jgi:hypothetical protein
MKTLKLKQNLAIDPLKEFGVFIPIRIRGNDRSCNVSGKNRDQEREACTRRSEFRFWIHPENMVHLGHPCNTAALIGILQLGSQIYFANLFKAGLWAF